MPITGIKSYRIFLGRETASLRGRLPATAQGEPCSLRRHSTHFGRGAPAPSGILAVALSPWRGASAAAASILLRCGRSIHRRRCGARRWHLEPPRPSTGASVSSSPGRSEARNASPDNVPVRESIAWQAFNSNRTQKAFRYCRVPPYTSTAPALPEPDGDHVVFVGQAGRLYRRSGGPPIVHARQRTGL